MNNHPVTLIYVFCTCKYIPKSERTFSINEKATSLNIEVGASSNTCYLDSS